MPEFEVGDLGNYNNGLECIWCGKSVKDMTIPDLISFIGMLDAVFSDAVTKIKDLENAKIK